MGSKVTKLGEGIKMLRDLIFLSRIEGSFKHFFVEVRISKAISKIL